MSKPKKGLYKRRPKLHQARQFTGGVENATEIIAWLIEMGVQKPMYRPTIKFADGARTMREMITFQDGQYGERVLHPNYWVVFDSARSKEEDYNTDIYLLSPEGFKFDYKFVVEERS